jgi:hypothetical protein
MLSKVLNYSIYYNNVFIVKPMELILCCEDPLQVWLPAAEATD